MSALTAMLQMELNEVVIRSLGLKLRKTSNNPKVAIMPYIGCGVFEAQLSNERRNCHIRLADQ
eukprot:12477014-Ditylum_brightwellii.AAC.1